MSDCPSCDEEARKKAALSEAKGPTLCLHCGSEYVGDKCPHDPRGWATQQGPTEANYVIAEVRARMTFLEREVERLQAENISLRQISQVRYKLALCPSCLVLIRED